MVLPPVVLAASSEKDIEVELDAVALYITEPEPWQRVEAAPCVKTGVPMVGVEVAVCVEVSGRYNLPHWRL